MMQPTEGQWHYLDGKTENFWLHFAQHLQVQRWEEKGASTLLCNVSKKCTRRLRWSFLIFLSFDTMIEE